MYILISLHSFITILHLLNLILSAGKYWYSSFLCIHCTQLSSHAMFSTCTTFCVTVLFATALNHLSFLVATCSVLETTPTLLVVVYCQLLSIPAPDGKHAYCGTLQPRMFVAEYIPVQMMSLS